MVTYNTAGLNLNVLLVSKPSTISTISLSITTVHAPMMLCILSVKINPTDGAVIRIHNTGMIAILRPIIFESLKLLYQKIVDFNFEHIFQNREVFPFSSSEIKYQPSVVKPFIQTSLTVEFDFCPLKISKK